MYIMQTNKLMKNSLEHGLLILCKSNEKNLFETRMYVRSRGNVAVQNYQK
jgi:hypothetical protein